MKSALAARPLRSDAAENLRRILTVALEVVSEQGVDASMEQIAHRAGVGVGTLYRRFPNKDALVDALIDRILDDLLEAADEALGVSGGDGLEQYLRVLGLTFVRRHGCLKQLTGRTVPGAKPAVMRTRIDQLVRDAHHHGRLAPTTTRGDVQALIWALRGVAEATADVAPHAWERHLDLHLAALRQVPAPTHLPGLTRAQLDAIGVNPAASSRTGR